MTLETADTALAQLAVPDLLALEGHVLGTYINADDPASFRECDNGVEDCELGPRAAFYIVFNPVALGFSSAGLALFPGSSFRFKAHRVSPPRLDVSRAST
jgi:hypothetical protein